MTVLAELVNENWEVKQSTWVGAEDVARLRSLIGQEEQDVSVFGDGFSLGTREISGGVFVWTGPLVTLRGRKIPVGGYSLGPGHTATFKPVPGSEVEIRIIENVDSEAPIFDALGPAEMGDEVIFMGLPLSEQIRLSNSPNEKIFSTLSLC